MTGVVLPFLLGVAVMACAVIGAFFFQFWRLTRDRLFLAFALAFWLFGINWAMLAILQQEGAAAVYLFRLVGFVFILVGIVGKNRSRNANNPRAFVAAPTTHNE